VTDIVETLRVLAHEYHQHRPYYTEAADEITRLRAQRDELVRITRKIVDAWVGKTEPMGDETFDEYIEPIIEEAYAAIAAVEDKP
jgi:hypothetical protein